MTLFRQNPNRELTRINCSQDTILTEQAHKADCDIKSIMLKFAKSGIITHNNNIQGQYENYVDGPTYQEAQLLIADANSMFETVPAHIRADFGNDPAKFLEFTQNPNNKKQMEAYGLLTAPPPALTPDPIPSPKKEPKTADTANDDLL